MLHITKLAVGIRDVAHLRAVQTMRAATNPPLRHQTRNMPRRAAEIIDGGSIYWVIAGAIVVRQRVRDVIADVWDDGSACAGLVLDPALVSVIGRPTRAFQGWRYLTADDAPVDVGAGSSAQNAQAVASDVLPAEMKRELQALGLL